MTFKSIVASIYLIAICSTACNESSKNQNQASKTAEAGITEMPIKPPVDTKEFDQNFAQQCMSTIKEIDAYAMQAGSIDTTLNLYEEGNTPVRYWRDGQNQPIKIEYGVKDDNGDFTGVFRFYFIDGKLWLADQLFAKYIFDSNNELRYWLSETWMVSETKTTANFVDRKELIQRDVKELLHKLKVEKQDNTK